MKIATRRSPLARAQAEWVAQRLRSAHPGLECELVEVTTAGDRDLASPVTVLTEVGAFVRAVQEAVLSGRADVAVHSCKDLPVSGPAELGAVYPLREAPWDVICGPPLDALPAGARIGTGSPRRSAQLTLIRPDVEVASIRGNVETRLGKVETGEYHAVVLAEAALRRIGREDAIAYRFSLDEMVPAAGQGALAVEARADGNAWPLLRAIGDVAATDTVSAERELLGRTRAGCRSALGAYAVTTSGGITLTGFVADERGPRRAVVTAPNAGAAADDLAHRLGLQ